MAQCLIFFSCYCFAFNKYKYFLSRTCPFYLDHKLSQSQCLRSRLFIYLFSILPGGCLVSCIFWFVQLSPCRPQCFFFSDSNYTAHPLPTSNLISFNKATFPLPKPTLKNTFHLQIIKWSFHLSVESIKYIQVVLVKIRDNLYKVLKRSTWHRASLKEMRAIIIIIIFIVVFNPLFTQIYLFGGFNAPVGTRSWENRTK